MKSVMMSIHPLFCTMIADGEKTLELRKTMPKCDIPFKVYIYCTKPYTGSTDDRFYIYKPPHDTPWQVNGMVVGEFICDYIELIEIRHFTVFGHENLYTSVGQFADLGWLKKTGLSYNEVSHYGNFAPLFGWHISNLVIYDKPKVLTDFIVPSKVGCCNEGKCMGCKYFDRGNGFNLEDDCAAPFSTDEYKPLRRPPRSWCYVDNLKGI